MLYCSFCQKNTTSPEQHSGDLKWGTADIIAAAAAAFTSSTRTVGAQIHP